MSNVIKAIINIINHRNAFAGVVGAPAANRVNAIGVSLEHFVRDAFAGTFGNAGGNQRWVNTCFSYLGGGNTPPDMILTQSDAIEVKKENGLSQLQLNSSFPKDKLFSTNPKISNAARNCDGGRWLSKDMLYVIGTDPQPQMGPKKLWMIYGDCFCASPQTYQALEDDVKNTVQSIPGYNWTVTNELARADGVDPLGIADMRVRAMWMLQHPNVLFQGCLSLCIQQHGASYANPHIFLYNRNATFQMWVLMSLSKFNTLPLVDKQLILNMKGNNMLVEEVDVADPNNPAVSIRCKLISYSI